jgi:hypothetical protein
VSPDVVRVIVFSSQPTVVLDSVASDLYGDQGSSVLQAQNVKTVESVKKKTKIDLFIVKKRFSVGHCCPTER